MGTNNVQPILRFILSIYFSLSSQPNIFRGVKSCDQVAVEYQLFLWLSTALNLVQFIVATVTVSLVSRYKTILTQVGITGINCEN